MCTQQNSRGCLQAGTGVLAQEQNTHDLTILNMSPSQTYASLQLDRQTNLECDHVEAVANLLNVCPRNFCSLLLCSVDSMVQSSKGDIDALEGRADKLGYLVRVVGVALEPFPRCRPFTVIVVFLATILQEHHPCFFPVK